MRKQSILIALISISFVLSAQNNKKENNIIDLHHAPLYVSVSLDAQQSGLSLLEEKMAHVGINFKQTKVLNSAAGRHFFYQIEKDNIPFYGQKAAIHDYPNGFATVQYPILSTNYRGDFSSSIDLEMLKGDLKAERFSSEPIYWANQNSNFKALRTDFFGHDGLHYVLISADDEILVLEDQRLYFQGVDSTCTANVFAPDPLSTANVNYGGSYVDNNDGPMPILDLERQNITFKADYSNGTFRLENADLKISDFSSPSIAPLTQSSPNFNLTRDKDGFEDVNAFAHLSIFKNYIDSLGFSSIPGNLIEIDVHALSDADQSFFTSSDWKIYMGEGGVDDAEDVDVVIHEYIHAVVFGAAANSNRINERAGMEEAICDYFALSYSNKYTTNQSDRIFNWDGHNVFWPGRDATSTKDYQTVSFAGNIYTNTDLMVSCLREILFNTSRATSDQIILEALFSLQGSSTYRDFAIMIINADQVLNNGANYNIIKDAFVRRNVLDSDFSLDESIESKSSISLYNSLAFASGGSLFIKSVEALQSYQILSLDGKLIQAGELNGLERELAAPNLKTGLYLIIIQTSSSTESFKVFRN
tara:strand:+ start:50294 stop:52057 length:1764 start_codon:yes stop_codon:yes gene_type:complete